jgi:hypothetical protein
LVWPDQGLNPQSTTHDNYYNTELVKSYEYHSSEGKRPLYTHFERYELLQDVEKQ